MKLFHGTSKGNAQMIVDGEWRGSDLTKETDGFTSLSGEGVVFLTDSREEAAGYGDTIISVEVTEATFFQIAGHSCAREYFVPAEDLNNSGYWYVE